MTILLSIMKWRQINKYIININININNKSNLLHLQMNPPPAPNSI